MNTLTTALLLGSLSQSHPPAPPPRADLYACEGCEAILEVEPCSLGAQATVAGATEPGERLRLSGRVYRSDGQSPAAQVLIYLHQTHAGGRYEGGNGSVWARRHGRLRAWVRSDAEGRYQFDTIVPGIYPDLREPAHLHLVVQESGRAPYYLDDVVFAGATGVDADYLARQPGRGGPGVVEGHAGSDGTLQATRDIVLERHPAGAAAGRVWICDP